MAQHSLAFTDILQKNIRHVYSGRPSNTSFRKHPPPLANNRIDVPRRIDELQKRSPGRFRHTFEEYLPEYDISLPRAPAFNTLKGPEVDHMVERLTRPNRRENRHGVTCEMASAKKVSPEEMETIITRLNRPTKSSMVRIMMRTPNAESQYKITIIDRGTSLLGGYGKGRVVTNEKRPVKRKYTPMFDSGKK